MFPSINPVRVNTVAIITSSKKAVKRWRIDENPAFQDYTNLLWDYIMIQQFQKYVIKRLFDLNIITYQVKKLINIISNYPNIFVQIVNVINNYLNSFTSEFLNKVYIACLFDDDHIESNFRKAIIKCGADFKDSDIGPEIKFPKMPLIKIVLPDNFVGIYAEIKWKRNTIIAMRNIREKYSKSEPFNYRAH